MTDTGIGFDDAAKARIFDRFAQADDSITRRYGGSGLGLSICVDLVRAMGGELAARSSPGEGSTFAFELRLLRAKAAPYPVAGPQLAERALWILFADDHPVNRQVIELILTRSALS